MEPKGYYIFGGLVMKRERINTIGFTNGNTTRSAEKMIRAGLGIVVGGVLLAAAGFKRMINTQYWYQEVTDDGQESIRKLHDSIKAQITN